MMLPYYRIQKLPDQVRSVWKIKSQYRRDCTNFFDLTPFRKELEIFVNGKGQFYLYLSNGEGIVKAEAKRLPDFTLSNGSYFTGVYISDSSYPEYGYGDFGDHGLLFIMNPDLSSIELLVIPHCKNYVRFHYQKLVDGEYDQALAQSRTDSGPFFNYGE